MSCLRLPATLLAATLAVSAGAVAGEEAWPRYEPRPLARPAQASYLTPSGAIAVVGYNDMAEMLGALTKRFSELHAGFCFALDLKGTRTAPPALAAGTSALAPMGAEYSARELADYRAATGGDPVVVRVAHASLDPRALSGPLAIVVHRTNPLNSLSLSEVAAIFSGAAGASGLQPVGLRPELALGLFFRDRVLGARSFAAHFIGLAQSAEVMKRVGEDPRAIGFAAAMRAGPDVKVLALAPSDGGEPVALTEANLRAGRYPLDRHLLIAARRPLEPWVREFFLFVLSREGQRIIADGSLGYLPLSALDVAGERTKLAGVP